MEILDLASRVVGLMALIAIAFGSIHRLPQPALLRNMGHGLAFGCAAVICMLFPVQLPDGTLLSGRSLFLAFAAAFGGYATFGIASLVTSAYHLFEGSVALPQILQPMIVAGLLGLSWRYLIKARFGQNIWSLIGLGFWISLVTLLVLILSEGDGWRALLTVYPIALTVCVAGSIILGTLIEREVRHFNDEKAWRNQSFTDALTGLPNRRLFQADYQSASVSKERFALVVLDVDHFKAVNDSFGHPVGDEVLKRIASVLRNTIPSRATAYRLGGEEFAILLRGGTDDRARLVAEEVRRLIADRPEQTGSVVQPSITVSAGVATVEAGGKDRDIIAAADAALYYAKASGRNRVAGWDALRNDRSLQSPKASLSHEKQTVTGSQSNVFPFPR
ncbi:sensor domain-containing diguanylate cyclase [Agrobacterium pusense]|uniref:GGDEF domain-containing protein n=1 Tax=Agrobacterium pusense TaxID=648995 RepID=UPI001F18C51C|nr:GGDEF domain-containing protein [Agrobacterium pusense]